MIKFIVFGALTGAAVGYLLIAFINADWFWLNNIWAWKSFERLGFLLGAIWFTGTGGAVAANLSWDE